jgi:ATP-dependent DNA ligase
LDARSDSVHCSIDRDWLGHLVRRGHSAATLRAYSKHIGHHGIWVEPSLLAEIEYRAKSAEGKVRHPFFKGQREDL